MRLFAIYNLRHKPTMQLITNVIVMRQQWWCSRAGNASLPAH